MRSHFSTALGVTTTTTTSSTTTTSTISSSSTTTTSTSPFVGDLVLQNTDKNFTGLNTGTVFTIDSITAANPAVVACSGGSELVTNGNFSAWTGDNPDNFSVIEDANNYITESSGCRIVSDNSLFSSISQTISLTTGYYYIISINISDNTLGSIKFRVRYAGLETYQVITGVGPHTYVFLATSNSGQFTVGRDAACDITITSASVKPIHNLTAGDNVILQVDDEQRLGPDIPRTFAVASGSPVINGDTVSFLNEVSSVSDFGYWSAGTTYIISATISNYIGTGGILIPYDGSLSGDGGNHPGYLYANGNFVYNYIPSDTLCFMYSRAGHTADVTVNYIKEVIFENSTPYRITSIDSGTGAITLDADFSGLGDAVSSGYIAAISFANYTAGTGWYPYLDVNPTLIDSGILTEGNVYSIQACETDHFYTGNTILGIFTSDGTETCDANNTVLLITTTGAQIQGDQAEPSELISLEATATSLGAYHITTVLSSISAGGITPFIGDVNGAEILNSGSNEQDVQQLGSGDNLGVRASTLASGVVITELKIEEYIQ